MFHLGGNDVSIRSSTCEKHPFESVTERAGDLRTALAALRELSRIVELMAKSRGELPEGGETKILNVNIDSETAKRIVDTFLARHQESSRLPIK